MTKRAATKPVAKAEAAPVEEQAAPKLRYVEARGVTLHEMRDAVRVDPLYQAGDLRLVWVLEADLAAQDVKGA